jgi:uncharacterized protein YkwD
VNPVVLSYNSAAQTHARDMFDKYFMSHRGTYGLKPYLRYTQSGRLGSEQESVVYSGTPY